LLVAIVGIAALIIPVILSISSDYNIGSRLDSGEIRKSIVISLTIIYIIFLVMSFDQTLDGQPKTDDGKYLLNATYDENTNDTAHKIISINITSTSEGVLQVIPVTATANVSNGTVQITPLPPQKPSTGDGGGGMIPLTGDNGTSMPADAISSFTKNFLWVYALIISFYFGSRILEDRTDRSNIKDYIQKLITDNADPIDIATKRYVLGDIGSREFTTMKLDLKEPLNIRIENVEFEQKNKDIFAVLSIWNGTNKRIIIDRVYIDRKKCKIEGDSGMDPSTRKDIRVSSPKKVGEKIWHIKISTDAGIESDMKEYLHVII
jgi:hypothetical protein